MSIEVNTTLIADISPRDLRTRRDLFEMLMRQVDLGYEKEIVAFSALSALADDPDKIECIDHCINNDPGARLNELGYTAVLSSEVVYCPDILPSTWIELMPRSSFNDAEQAGDPSVEIWRQAEVVIDPGSLDKTY